MPPSLHVGFGSYTCSPASCSDPPVIRQLSGIVLISPSHFDGSPALCPDSLVILAALWHHVGIP
uniref:Uncharacterized protein n=1 Tax=Vitis vinifera TaxID=29760 RepID=A5AUB9_VITVI|nr:hypothetical protein VITISV_027829 [Vitis vinifera]